MISFQISNAQVLQDIGSSLMSSYQKRLVRFSSSKECKMQERLNESHSKMKLKMEMEIKMKQIKEKRRRKRLKCNGKVM